VRPLFNTVKGKEGIDQRRNENRPDVINQGKTVTARGFRHTIPARATQGGIAEKTENVDPVGPAFRVVGQKVIESLRRHCTTTATQGKKRADGTTR